MALQPPEPFNLKDISLDVRLETITDGGTSVDFTGKKTFSVDFFREGVSFGITDIEIEVNTSLQPIITITFKDLYGNTVFGKTKQSNPDLSQEENIADFSALFDWPPPKFKFTFKGFLGKSCTWMLSMKKSSVSYNSSDGSYDIKCEFVPNQWGFLSDLPFLYLLAVKSLKTKDGADPNNSKTAQSIFDIIKIGKQVEVKTNEATKEFDGILKQMTLLKSGRVYDAVGVSKVVNFDETINGQVGGQSIVPFNPITIVQPSGVGNNDIAGSSATETLAKMASFANNGSGLTTLNNFLLLTSQIGSYKPDGSLMAVPSPLSQSTLTFAQYSALDSKGKAQYASRLSSRVQVLDENIKHIEDAIKLKTYNSSKNQLEKLTIGEVFKQLVADAGYIMGKILEVGVQGYEQNKESRTSNIVRDKIIGVSFPLIITDKKEEKPASKAHLTEAGISIDLGVDNFELAFITDFINAIAEGIATELAEDNSASESVGDSLIKKRISNLEALQGNPYKPYYQSIAENIMIRSGIVGYLIRSSDPNYPGDYDTAFGVNRASNASDVVMLADADLENITDSIIGALTADDFKSLKNFCTYWDNLLTEDCQSLLKPATKSTSGNTASPGQLIEGDKLDGVTYTYLCKPGDVFSTVNVDSNISSVPVSILDYPVVIEKPANWDGDITANAPGLMTLKLRQIIQGIFRAGNQNSGNIDASNSNFIDTEKNLQAVKVINNQIAYFKPPQSIDHDYYVYVMFSGPDATKTQNVNSSQSDGDVKNDASTQKDKKDPLGYVNIQNPYKDGNSAHGFVEVIDAMNNGGGHFSTTPPRIANKLLLDYSRLIAPSNAFFSNNTDLTDVEDYFFVNNNFGNPDAPLSNEIAAKGISLSVAYHPSNSQLVFGPFVKDAAVLGSAAESSLIQRGYIKRICSQLKTKLVAAEQKKNQIISDVLGKAADQNDLLYKQMHTIYQQWKVLIIKDEDSSNNQNTAGNSPGAVLNDVANRYGNHLNLTQPQNVLGDKTYADNTFIYGYPMNFFEDQSPKVEVRNSIINIEPLYKPNGNTTILNIIQQICTKNNFIFIPMPGEPGAFSTDTIFTPQIKDNNTSIRNFFYVQFAPTPESRSTIGNGNKSPISSIKYQDVKLPIGTVLFKFGSPDNQILKNIQVDTQESKNTAESIVNLQRLVDNENQNKKVTTDCSLLPIMEGRSYRATAEMLGNAQVFPMQFFYLDSIPIFNGLYQIMKVKHSIKPNDMTTTAEGIRMRMDGNSNFGAIQPITLDTLINLTGTTNLITTVPTFTPGVFANYVADQGDGAQDGKTGAKAAGSGGKTIPTNIGRGAADIVPNSVVDTNGIILLPNIVGAKNSIRLTQSSNANGASTISDFTDASGVLYPKTDTIRYMNEFIQDILDPFAAFLKQFYPKLYRNWYITSATRSFVPAGGSKVSQHQKGQAVDSQIINRPLGVETMKANLELLNAILEFYKLNPLGYGQILWETRASQNASWIHWSYKRNDHRLQLYRFKSDKKAFAINGGEGKYVPPGVTPDQVGLTMA